MYRLIVELDRCSDALPGIALIILAAAPHLWEFVLITMWFVSCVWRFMNFINFSYLIIIFLTSLPFQLFSSWLFYNEQISYSVTIRFRSISLSFFHLTKILFYISPSSLYHSPIQLKDSSLFQLSLFLSLFVLNRFIYFQFFIWQNHHCLTRNFT